MTVPRAAQGSVAINVTTSGDHALVAAVTGRCIRLVQCGLMAAAAVGVKFDDGTSDLTGPFPLGANTGFVLGPSTLGYWLETGVGNPLNINLSLNTTVAGVLFYALV